ncbi:DPP IV N-terminal domain-containing protein [Solirubrobacter phytolaccae]|uniref:DPP IV N-terminal domain-containing protein n=1 Tax=Solirubrobacter phytolaccae TaxID=1404360 RepID=A0A9X3N4I2_9ACTN|nr:DPP IV N-terminal domain-containing protein [Solirubrobacter phytolaccae]MDA0179489.1 DPP IV N-terminal domain-containing protein [Solirubrobacter phytolaccae]
MTHAHRAWLLAGAIGLASAAPSAAAEPVNGRLVYTSFESSADPLAGDLWTMNADGTDKQQAVFDPAYDAQPDWSPDGTRIAFRNRRNSRFESAILDFRVRDAAGRPVVTDIPHAGDGTQTTQPSWFPNGQGLLYRRTTTAPPTRSDVWAMNLDGTNRRPVVVLPEDQFYPSFSPDMRTVLFSTVKGADARNIQAMDVATGAITTLFDHSPRSYDSAPAWSPDGRQIAFESDLDGDREIYVMNADGSNVRQLTHNGNWEEGPAWSPDGTRLAFTRALSNTDYNVWTMAPDGTDQRQLTTYAGRDESPDWGRNPGPGTVGGTVPATLALSLDGAASFGTFTPGLDREYTVSARATVTSTAGSATLSVSDPGHLENGTYHLPQALRVEMTPATWTGPVSNTTVTLTFRQAIARTDALRTGTYTKTLTFTLTTTDP